MLKIFRLSIIFFLINFSSSSAETIKPNINIKPAQVVNIQLKGLMKAKTLRAEGITVELDVSVVSLPEAIKYAEQSNIGRIIIVGENGENTEHAI